MKTVFKITIEAARVNAGLSVKEAAAQLGISYASLRNFEKGTSEPTKQIIAKMCTVYSVPIEMLNINFDDLRDSPDPKLYKTRLYRIFRGMKQRCYNEKNPAYYLYGGKGITICDEWLHNFVAFYQWALNNGYADALTIDRINSNGDYCPENCRWITPSENSRHVWENPETRKNHQKAYYDWLKKHRQK